MIDPLLPGQRVPKRPFGRTPGEIAWALIPTKKRNEWIGRPRPVLILGVRRGDRIVVLPFTTRRPNARPERRQIDTAGTGLASASWLWHKTVTISEGDIGENLGWVNQSIIDRLNSVSGVTPRQINQCERCVNATPSERARPE